MRLKITTWDSHNINDQTNYDAVIQPGNAMPSAVAEFVSVGQANPVLANKVIDGGYFTFNIILRGNIETQRDELNKWFMVDDFSYRTLIAQDLDDSNKEWYLEGYPVTPPLLNDGSVGKYSITLALKQPYWRDVISGSSTWSITASGQTKVLTVDGNKAAQPILTITPTSAKTGGYLYSQWKPWYNPLRTYANEEPLEITNGGLNTAALVADTSNSCQINVGGGISAALTTIPYDTVTGTMPSAGSVYCGTEQIGYTGKTGTTSGNLTGCTRGINGTTAATHADNALMYKSKMMANGDDLRVLVNKVEVERWLTGINSATTKIWINQYSPMQPYLFLNTTVAGAGSITTISVTNPYAYQGEKIVAGELSKLPSTFLFAIGTEVFTGRKTTSPTSFTVTARSVKNTSIAAHAIGDRIIFITNDIEIMYGNYSATTPVSDDTRKPMITLSTSTNTSWVWAEFSETTGQRTAEWRANMPYTGNNEFRKSGAYTATQITNTNPSTDIGVTVGAWTNSVTWMPPYSSYLTGNVYWKFNHAALISTLTVTGLKYRYTSDWPTFVVATNNPPYYTVLFTEATPTASQVWQALSSHSGVAVNARGVALVINGGTLAASANNKAAMELTDATVTFTSGEVMQLLSTIVENNNFFLDAVISNDTTEDTLSIKLAMELNKALVIDCEAQTVEYNGVDIGCPLRWNSVRSNWLDIEPGSNTLSWTENGVIPGITVEISWKDRSTL